jgi:hypothetical protein
MKIYGTVIQAKYYLKKADVIFNTGLERTFTILAG